MIPIGDYARRGTGRIAPVGGGQVVRLRAPEVSGLDRAVLGFLLRLEDRQRAEGHLPGWRAGRLSFFDSPLMPPDAALEFVWDWSSRPTEPRTLRAGQELGFLTPGTPVRVTDAARYWTDRPAVVEGVRWTDTGVIDLEIRALFYPAREVGG